MTEIAKPKQGELTERCRSQAKGMHDFADRQSSGEQQTLWHGNANSIDGIAFMAEVVENERDALAIRAAELEAENVRLWDKVHDEDVRNDQLEATIERVRELHVPGIDSRNRDVCGTCESDSGPLRWPCPTIRALDGRPDA